MTPRPIRSEEDRRAIVEAIDLRIQSGGMTHREATRLEGVSDALVHAWRRKMKGPAESTLRRAAKRDATQTPPPVPDRTRLPVAEVDVEVAAEMLQKVRAGGKAVLQFDGDGWQVRVV